MTTTKAYLQNLRNVSPDDLEIVFNKLEVSVQMMNMIFANLYTAQRDDSSRDVRVSEIVSVTEEEFEDGLWISTMGLNGRVTDAHRTTVGIGPNDVQISLVVDGKIHNLDPDQPATIYTMPIEPEEA